MNGTGDHSLHSFGSVLVYPGYLLFTLLSNAANMYLVLFTSLPKEWLYTLNAGQRMSYFPTLPFRIDGSYPSHLNTRPNHATLMLKAHHKPLSPRRQRAQPERRLHILSDVVIEWIRHGPSANDRTVLPARNFRDVDRPRPASFGVVDRTAPGHGHHRISLPVASYITKVQGHSCDTARPQRRQHVPHKP